MLETYVITGDVILREGILSNKKLFKDYLELPACQAILRHERYVRYLIKTYGTWRFFEVKYRKRKAE